MFHFRRSHRTLLLFAALWSFGCSRLHAASPGIGQSKPKNQLDPNVREWGDYSDLPAEIQQGLELDKQGEHGDKKEASSSLAPELDFLADFTGKTNKVIK